MKTHPWAWIGGMLHSGSGMSAALCLAMTCFVGACIQGSLWSLFSLLGLVWLAAAVLLAGATGRAMRIHGGMQEVRLYPDRVELPRANHAGRDVFPLDELHVAERATYVTVNASPVLTGFVLEFAHGSTCRLLSHHLFTSRAEMHAFFGAIQRAQRSMKGRAGQRPR